MRFLKNKVVMHCNEMDTEITSGDAHLQSEAPELPQEETIDFEDCSFSKDFFGSRREHRGPDKCF